MKNVSDFKLFNVLRSMQGRMAEWSKALVLGTSHYGGAGSNPAPVNGFLVDVTVKLQAKVNGFYNYLPQFQCLY